MRRRPLCFLCIVLVILNYVLIVSGDFSKSPDILFSEAIDQKSVTVYGEIYQCEYKEGQQTIYLKETVLSLKTKKNKAQSGAQEYYKLKRIKITCPLDTKEYKIGDLVSAYGVLKEIAAASNPGQFDSQSYYAGKKISYTMWEPKLSLIKRPDVHLRRSLYELRCKGAENIKDSFLCLSKYGKLETYADVMQGIVLGEKGSISSDTEQLYQIGGISHILAISAMHLTILANGLYGILKRFGASIHVSGVLSGVFLVLYGILTGASTSTLRALVMFLLNTGAQLTGRTYDGKTALSLAAVLLLSGNPLSLTDSGFLLSFTAMVSFMLFQEKRKIGSSILLYVFMTPVTLWLFYEIPLYSIIVNLLVVPTLPIVLILGVLVCLLGSITPVLGSVAAMPGALFLAGYEVLCKGIRHLPYAKLVLGRPTYAGIVIYYSVILFCLFIFRKYRLSWKRFFVFFCMIPAVFALVYHPYGKLRITAMDVGQGDCIVMELPNHHTYMVDGGSSSVKHVGTYRIVPYLKYRGIRTLETVFITHPDMDHINGVLEILELIKEKKLHLNINKLILPKWEEMEAFQSLLSLAEKTGIPVYTMEHGECYTDDEVRMECLHPKQKNYSDKLNEGSLVLEVTYKSFTGLLTGDAQGAGEEELCENLRDVDYLKVAHHGSAYSTCESFLDKTKPEISVISCGKNNIYGHPHKDLLTRLDAVSSDQYATKDYGAIWITTDGETIDLSAFCKYN